MLLLRREWLTLAFTSLTPGARARAAELFDRVFASAGSDADIGSLVRDFDCKVIVLTPQDGAWSRDPFAASALFTRIEEAAGKWRIYRASHRNEWFELNSAAGYSIKAPFPSAEAP